jgi:glycosyltransferase involved in cell wall biosynthesis
MFWNTAWMGGIQYVLNIARMLRALPAEARPQEVVFLAATPAADEIAWQHANLVDRIAPFQRAGELGLDFIYPATQLAEAPFGAPWAGWIPDWQSLHLPNLFNARELARRFIQYRVLAKHSPVIILSSQMALEDTQKLFGGETGPLRLLHFPAIFDDEVYSRPAERLAETRKRLGIPDRYVLICNQFWAHKNHLAAIRALGHVREDVHLVMTGELDDKRWPAYAEEMRAMLAAPDVARRVTLTGRIERDAQIDLMLGALGFLQPSRFEGWSTFVEEARALGRPILLSEFPVHREQAPPGGVFFDPDSPEQLAALLDEWFARLPASIPLPDARARNRDFVLECARSFMDIARLARSEFRAAEHDPKPVAAAALLEIQRDVAAHANGLTQDDQNKFESAIRQLFCEYPVELDKLSEIVCNPAYPLYPHACKALIDATIPRMSEEAKQVFYERQPGRRRH